MRRSASTWRGALLLALGLLWLAGCAGRGAVERLLPPVYEYRSYLVGAGQGAESSAYVVNADSSVTFDRQGLRITARPLGDAELNRRYPDVSRKGSFSANPFTYGNWRDSRLGYTPVRFTVFEIEVFNPVLPKVEFYPEQTSLHTDQGDEYAYYAINREDSPTNFEDYYTLGRGAGGNDQYRFDQRMGIVREELYRSDHQVFKGDSYKGYLVFDPIREGVSTATLKVRNLALEFDEANHPSKTMDLVFQFDHRVAKRQLTGSEARRARQRDWILPSPAQR